MSFEQIIDAAEKAAAENIKAEQGDYIVYKHTCPNGKVYIGITSQLPRVRWKYGGGYKHSAHFYAAIQKYGWNNIKHEILFENLTKEEAEQKEIALIALYKSTDREYGYNIAEGGIVHRQTPETRKRMSESKKNISPETRKKLSEAIKGQKRSAELRALWSAQRKGKGTTAVRCVETGIVYNSIIEAAEAVGAHPTNISRASRNVKSYATVKGFRWERVK